MARAFITATGRCRIGSVDVTSQAVDDPAHIPYMNVINAENVTAFTYCDPSPRYTFETEISYTPPKKIWYVMAVGDHIGLEYTDTGDQWIPEDHPEEEHWIKTYTNTRNFAVFIRFQMVNWDDQPEWSEPDSVPTYEEQYYTNLNKDGYFLLFPGDSFTIDGVGSYQNGVNVFRAVPYNLEEPFRKYKSQLIDGTPIESVGLGVVHPMKSNADFGAPFKNLFGLAELPLLWRTVGLKDKIITDLDGNEIPHGEYYFIDPFAPFPPTVKWQELGEIDMHVRSNTLNPSNFREAPIKIDNDRVPFLESWYNDNRAETSELNPIWRISGDKYRDFLAGKKTMTRIFEELANPDIKDLDEWREYHPGQPLPNESPEPTGFPIDIEYFGDLMYEGYCESLKAHFGRTFSNNESDAVLGKLPIHWLKTTCNPPYTVIFNGVEPTRFPFACMSNTDKEGKAQLVFLTNGTDYWMQKKAAFAILGIEPREETFSFEWSAPFGGKGQASLAEALAGNGWSASLDYSIWNDHHSSAELHCWVPNPRAGRSYTQPNTTNIETAYEYINDFTHYGAVTSNPISTPNDDIEFRTRLSVDAFINDLEAPQHYDMVKDWKTAYDSMGVFSGLSLTGQPIPYNGYFPVFSGQGVCHAAYPSARWYWKKVDSGKGESLWNNGDFIRAHVASSGQVNGANGCLITDNGIFDIENIKKLK